MGRTLDAKLTRGGSVGDGVFVGVAVSVGKGELVGIAVDVSVG